jgi:hypothetical protein
LILLVVLQPVVPQETVVEAEPSSTLEEGEIDDEMKSPIAPCSCDCCLVAEREPGEVITLPGGEELTRKCVAPPAQFDTQVCAGMCHPSDAEIVLTSVKESMDLARYCTFNCRPATKTIGTVCNKMQSQDIASSFTLDGNGNADTKAFYPLQNRDESWGSGPSNARLQSAHDKNVEDKKKANSLSGDEGEVKYDIRKVIAMRKRAEAASNIGRAAAAEASTKSNREKSEHMARKVDRVLNALQESDGAAGASEVQAGAAATDAAVDASDARAALAEGRVLAKAAAKQAEKLARGEIKKAVAAAAKVEGESDAFRYGWDKPPNWGSIVAQTMANPYLTQMVAATWRANEYEGYARGILGQAEAAQKQAKLEKRQANQYAAAGDTMQAKMMDAEVKNLISKSHNLEAQAEAEWKKANSIQMSQAEWQQAGVLAAGHAKWAWSNYFTPPPPMDKVPFWFRHKINPMDWTDKSKR